MSLHIHQSLHLYGLSQDVASKVLADLGRPPCVGARIPFIRPDVQCPQKPRGRKKTIKTAAEPESKPLTTSRPSAAACGFDTVGMSDLEVQQRLQQCYGDNVPPKPKKGGKVGDKVDNPDGVEHPKVEPASVTKTERMAKKAKGSTETMVEPIEPAALATRSKRKAKGGDMKANAANENNAEPVEPAELATRTTKRRRRTAKGKKGKRAHVVEDVEGCNDQEAKAARKRNTTATSARSSSSTPAPAVEPVDPKAETKARVSRKSAAYHRAVKAAEREGKTKMEAKELGKIVSRINCVICLLQCVLLHVCRENVAYACIYVS